MPNDTPSAYPLAWPAGWPRTKSPETSRFKTTLASALKELMDEVRLLGGKNTLLSSNVTLGSDRPADKGVVAYFMYEEKQVAIPCDRWHNVESNVKAIALTINAMRGMERWGAKHMIRAMFQGFVALPAPAGDRPWWTVLGFTGPLMPGAAALASVEEAYRAGMKKAHPDAGGSHERAAELNAAIAEARTVLK